MLKLQTPKTDNGQFHNFRCGEVLCVGATTYHVCCALCGQKIVFDSFPQHFRLKHLYQSSDHDCIQTERPENNDENILDVLVKAEDDPIGPEEIQNINVDLAQIRMLDIDCTNDAELINEPISKIIELNNDEVVLEPTLQKNSCSQSDNSNEMGDMVSQESILNKTQLLIEKSSGEEEFITLDDESYDEEVIEYNAEYKHEMLNDPDWTEETQMENNSYNNDSDDIDNSSGNNVDIDMLFPCNECDRHYNSQRGLQYHKRMKHSSKQSQIGNKKRNSAESPKEFKCNDCSMVFRKERDLRGHRWKHTGIFCDICGKPFTQTGNMMRHRVRHTGIKAFKCKDCDSSFYTKKELKSHSICHTKRMPVICEICGRPCRDRGVLTAHMRRHTGERPAKCEVCGKSFYSYHDLNVHAVAHTSERPFRCDVCGSTFQRKKALRVHKLLHLDQRKYVCKICGKAFAQSGGLNAHMRTHDATLIKTNSAARTTSKGNCNNEIEEEIEPNQEALDVGISTTEIMITKIIP